MYDILTKSKGDMFESWHYDGVKDIPSLELAKAKADELWEKMDSVNYDSFFIHVYDADGKEVYRRCGPSR